MNKIIKASIVFLLLQLGYSAKAQVTDTITVHIGWNLISLSLIVPDNRVDVLFPNSISNAFYYDGSYKPCDTLEVGKGYWLKFTDADTILIAGNPIIRHTSFVNSGWNMIGTLTQACYAKEIITSPPGIIASEFYKWDDESGYAQTDSLIPGEGYWIKCVSSGNLVLESGSSGPTLVAPANFSENVTTALWLKWRPMVDVISYHLQVSKDPFFSKTISVDDPTLSDTIKTLCNVEYGERFYWRVRAVYPDSAGEWSVTWTFQTISMPQPTADSIALFMYVGGEPAGWYLLNPNTLEPLDSFLVSDNTVQFVYQKKPIEFSPNGSMWYTLIPGPYGQPDTLAAINAVTKEIIHQTESYWNQLVMDKDKKYIMQVYQGATLLFLDRNTFSLVNEIFFDKSWIIRTSPVSQTLYGVGIKEIGVVNIDSFRVEKIITINDTCFWSSPTDMEISPDGTNLFLTVNNSYEDCRDGTFYHVDLINDSVVASLPCGRYALIGVSPDNKYVYLSNPQDMFGEPFPTGKFIRYDVNSRTMEIYIDLYNFPGLSYGDGDAEQIIVSPGGESMFITPGGLACDGSYTRLTKIDIATKEVLKTFNFQPNQQGYITQYISGLKIGQLMR